MQTTDRMLPAALALLASAAVWGGDSTGNFAQEVPADARGTVEISSTSGTIDVTGSDKAAVSVQARLGPEVDHVEVKSSGNHTVVRVILKPHGSGIFNWGHDETRLRVQVPKDSELDVSGVSADVTSGGVLGVQRLRSVSGDVSAETGPNDIDVKSVSGNLKVRGHGQPARLRLTTVSGDIELKHAAGELETTTTSGQISVELDPARSFHARSTSGDITFEGRLARGADVDAQSVNGDLKVHVAAEDGFQYELQTLSGDIGDCFGAKAERSGEYGPGHKLEGTRGGGSAHVRLKTLSGDLDLCDH
ncbi:MAG TPA: DUF4097 family beta strand repeat-containing protein [Steroidobacteraceae bacterium]|nr:DUF4097 family beta strand repeat-containing protein [Steroidobacteraceae bacterium]